MKTEETTSNRLDTIDKISVHAHLRRWMCKAEEDGSYCFIYFEEFLKACSDNLLMLLDKLDINTLGILRNNDRLEGILMDIKVADNVFLSITLTKNIAMFRFSGECILKYVATFINEEAIMYKKIMEHIGETLEAEIKKQLDLIEKFKKERDDENR